MEKYKIIARARWAFDIFHIFMKKIEDVFYSMVFKMALYL